MSCQFLLKHKPMRVPLNSPGFGLPVECNMFLLPPVIAGGILLSRVEKAMKTESITIRVTPQAATTYRVASEEDRRKMDLLMSLQLVEISRSSDSLDTAMNAMSEEAANSGLTPEILDSILHGT
jgi:hypothetical protein